MQPTPTPSSHGRVLRSIWIGLLLLAAHIGYAQFTISGPTCVTPGVQYTYTISGSWTTGTEMDWSATGTFSGSSSGTPLPAIHVTFSGGTTNYVKVNTFNPSGNYTLNVTVTGTVQGGTVNPATQTINYNTAPTGITCPQATGGGCSPSYTYQWQQSTDNVNFSNIPGASGPTWLNYAPGALTTTTYYRRFVTETVSGTTNYSSVATVVVNPQLNGGFIGPASQQLLAGSSPGQLGGLDANGGGCSSYLPYQWQSSADNVTFVNAGGSGTTFLPSAIQGLTYYRRQVTCNGQTAWSNVVTVDIENPFNQGMITPTTTTINPGQAPGQLSSSNPTGGFCQSHYGYQWQQKLEGGSMTNISGATGQTYTPGNLNVNTYYDLVTICGSQSLTSNNSAVKVAIVPGALTPTLQYIYTGANASTLSINGATGGAGTYTYQWQSAPDASFSTITNVGTNSTSFTPTGLTATTNYRVQVSSTNSPTVYSNAVAVVVSYPPIVPGAITPDSQSISYQTTPIPLTSSAPQGGKSPFTYQWWYRPANASSWAIIPGATSLTYSPGPLAITTYYELIYTGSNGGGAVSDAIVAVSRLNPGILSPANIPIRSGVSPGLLSGDPASGGTSSTYTYQWYSSSDAVNWNSISGANGLTYGPGTLSTTTYYKREASCNGDNEYTNVSEVEVVSPGDLNYIRTRDLLKAGVTDTVTADGLTSPFDVTQVTQYFDGLGRSMQTVAKQATPLQKDMVTMNVYDNFGREASKYLPFPDSSATGNFKYTAGTDQYSFNSVQFPNEQFYYSLVSFEQSPLNRAMVAYPQGQNWTGSNRGTGMQYLVNQLSDSVRVWTIAYPVGSVPVTTATYPAGALYKTVTTDEAGHQVVEYKDLQGQIVLKKVQLAATPGTAHVGWLCTYYIYDDLGHLRFVLQPQAVVLVNSNWSISTTIASELCFRYEYDVHGRMNIKKVPGAGENWMVYDIRDRLVMSQDSNLRAQHQWLFTCYDALNRADSTGLMTDPTNYNNLSYHTTAAMQSASYPTLSSYTVQLMTRNFYDDYTWVAATSAPVLSTFDASHSGSSSWYITSYNASPTYAVAVTPSYITRGMQTGVAKIVITTASQFLYTSMFYDDRGRLVQTSSNNYGLGKDTVTNQYNFAGKPLRSLHGQSKIVNTAQSHMIMTRMDYDQVNRLNHIYKLIDNPGSLQLICNMQYDELGQLNEKDLGNSLDKLVYSYNIRGWLTGINKDYVGGTAHNSFGMELAYDNGTSITGTTYTTPEYNGNIAGVIWKSSGDAIDRKYDFAYDNVNRLTGANFNQYVGSTWGKTSGGSSPVTIDFSVSGLGYDANGNILSMIQQGFKIGGSGTPIDSLTYTYTANSNKLLQVHDEYNDTASVLGDFHYKGVKGSSDYSYDGNGNLAKDNNKGLNNFSYNYLNLLGNVHVVGKGFISYVYDAGGTKLQKQVRDSTTGTMTFTSYIGEFQYTRRAPFSNINSGSDTLQFISTEEGRARWAFHKHAAGDTVTYPEYDFVERDHLGNERVVLTQERDTTQYVATMEAANRTTENALFYNLGTTCVARTTVPAPGYPNDTTFSSPNDSVVKLNGNGPTVGPAIILKVMSGDIVDVGTQYYYNSGTYTSSPPISPQNLLNSLASGLATLSSAAGESITTLTNPTTSPLLSALMSSVGNQSGTGTTTPQAYLNWVLLDKQFRYVAGSSGAMQVISAGQNGGKLQIPLAHTGISMSQSGYLYIYVSNATKGWDVFFDNMSVHLYTRQLLEENHYYPFGLTIAGISDKAIKPQYAINKFRYNGKELQNQEFNDGSGLELYDYGARMYDQQIGRWQKMDGKAELYFATSPYVYALNQPTNAVDPDGNLVIFINGMHFGSSGHEYWVAKDYYRAFVTNGQQPPAGYQQRGGHGSTGYYYKDREFDTEVMDHLDDHHAMYRDGSNGGVRGLTGNMDAGNRYNNGYSQGQADAEYIIENLARDKNGNIVESIKVISHSMGGAYAKGYVQAIINYAQTHKISGVVIEFEADFAPYQPTKQKAVKGKNMGPTLQYSHSNDAVAGNEDEPGAEKKDTKSDKNQIHDISSFFNQIANLPAGTYKVVNGQIVPDK